MSRSCFGYWKIWFSFARRFEQWAMMRLDCVAVTPWFRILFGFTAPQPSKDKVPIEGLNRSRVSRYQECIRVPLQVHCRPSSWRMVLNFYSHVRRSCGLTQGCEVFQHGCIVGCKEIWLKYVSRMWYDYIWFVQSDHFVTGIGAGPGSILCDQFSATIEGWRAWTDARFLKNPHGMNCKWPAALT